MAGTVSADVIGDLLEGVVSFKKSAMYDEFVEPRDAVLARFQPVFSAEHLPNLTEEEFRSFLLFENNHHWSGLHRQGSRMCSSMSKLREGITALLNEADPVSERLDKANEMVSGMGKNVASAILMVTRPDLYGVWNNRSEANMKRLGIWPKFDRSESFGSQYVKVNQILLQLRDSLNIDLWTLDALWWFLDQQESEEGLEEINWADKLSQLRIENNINEEVIESRKQSEEEARNLFIEKLGHLDEHDLRTFFKLVNKSNYQGKVTHNRYQLAFIGQNVSKLAKQLDELNKWFPRLWRTPEANLKDLLQEFWTTKPITHSGKGLPTLILYLRDPYKFNMWLSSIEKGLQKITGIEPFELTARGYFLYNQKVNEFRQRFGFQPQEIDFILYIVGKELAPPNKEGKRFWIFQANPEYYDLEGSLKSLKEQNWLVIRHKDKIRKGDKVYLWQSGLKAGIYAVADILTNPGPLVEDPAEKTFVKAPEKFEGEKTRVRLSIKQVLQSPLTKSIILKEPALSNLNIITAPLGTNFSLSKEQADLLEELINTPVKPNIWWVNQGTTLQAEKEGGFLWAPLKTKTGRSMSHWETMAEVSKEDIVVHYANGAIRYVSKVIEPAVETSKPASLMEGDWSNEGRLVRVDYHELTPLIPLQKFASALRPLYISQGPLDSSGGVKQGYLFRLTPEALGIIQGSQSETKWPDFARRPDIRTDGERQPIYTIDDLVKDTGFPLAVIDSWGRKLLRKKHVVFQGPPGTGKTYIAERLARLMVSETEGFWDLVQFHPAYAYEDFMQGIRPKLVEGGISYELVDGRFIEFCRKAREQANGAPCVLIIDEINRAHLSRVLGELMYLLEYRDKEIPLASGGALFRIPSNVYIIGTMNTADRSIALVDHALRRRFSFIRLKPDYNVLRKHLETYAYPADELITILTEINRAIDDPNYELGISFFMKEGNQLKAHLPDIWIGEIEPYLEEIFYDQPGKVEPFRWETLSLTKLKDVVI